MAGDSETPLLKKIGIKSGHRLYFENPPESLAGDLGPLPDGAPVLGSRARNIDVGILFVRNSGELKRRFKVLADRICSNGMIWICWPKKSSGVESDLDFDLVQKQGLATGLVDVKVCAIDETWSGLKFMVRKENR